MKQLFGRVLAVAFLVVCADATRAQSTALVADTAQGNGSNGFFYIVTAIDGKEVPNALGESRKASYGQGARMRVLPFSRAVAAGKVKLALRAVRAEAMPAATIWRSLFTGGEPEVSGNGDFELQAGRYYRVNGVLDDYRREVWLEDDLGNVVANKFSIAADPATVKAMEGASYTTTNLRYDGDWISDDPMVGLPFVPIGARMKVLEYRKDRAIVLIDGRKMRVGIDNQTGETIQQFVARITSSDDPRPKVAAWGDDPRAAVAAGRVLQGMTREQVVAALGRPRVDLVRTLEQPEWSYRLQSDGSDIFLVFGASGGLELVDGSRKARTDIFLGTAPTISMSPTAAGAPAPAAASAPQ